MDHRRPSGADSGQGAPDRGPEPSGEELPLPVGTLFFMMIFLMVMAGMWLAIYFEFLGR